MTSKTAADGSTLIGLGRRAHRVVLAGNPNVGKSSIFNTVTGLRQKVGNYPGITVERVEGRLATPAGDVTVVDLPGTYGLSARSPDERIARDAIIGIGVPVPDVVVIVADAANLARSLLLATQVIDAGACVVVALNQIDLAVARGIKIDLAALSRRLGVPVVPTCGRTGEGRDQLVAAIVSGGARGNALEIVWPGPVQSAAERLAPRLAPHLFGGGDPVMRTAEALTSETRAASIARRLSEHSDPAAQSLAGDVAAAREALEHGGVDVATTAASARYAAVDGIVAAVSTGPDEGSSLARGLDRVLTHPLLGSLALLGVFLLLFMVVFTWSGPAVDLVDTSVSDLGDWLRRLVGGGLLGSFVADGIVAGLGAFLVFVPQIALLFLCIEALEDSGYLARAAFLLDRAMRFFGLPGRSFLPLLSGFGCAIPAIMATRTIENQRDRFVTMAILPLMSCQARLPVYAVIVGALFASFGTWIPALVVLAMYVSGVVIGVVCAKILRRTLLAGPASPLLLELPPYRRPSTRIVTRNALRRTWLFVRGAGPIILVLMMILWVGVTFPRDAELSRDFESDVAALTERRASAGDGTEQATSLDEEIGALEAQEKAERLATSYLGRAAQRMEPVLEPLGFDWKIGVAILGSFAAREVFVPTLGVIYAVGDEVDEESEGLLASMRADRHPDGRPVFTPLVGIGLMVFYVIALQCVSTLGVLKRETNSWRWPIGLFVGYTILAWLAALLIFQVGTALGYA